jgi:hypothetical protein
MWQVGAAKVQAALGLDGCVAIDPEAQRPAHPYVVERAHLDVERDVRRRCLDVRVQERGVVAKRRRDRRARDVRQESLEPIRAPRCTSSSAPGEGTPDRSLIVSGNPSGRAAVDQTWKCGFRPRWSNRFGPSLANGVGTRRRNHAILLPDRRRNGDGERQCELRGEVGIRSAQVERDRSGASSTTMPRARSRARAEHDEAPPMAPRKFPATEPCRSARLIP